MERSLTSRGFKRGSNLHTITTLSKAIATLFVMSYEQAERVFYAMRSKGYAGKITTMHEFTLRPQDWLYTVLVCGFAIFVQVAVWYGTLEGT